MVGPERFERSTNRSLFLPWIMSLSL